MKNIRIRFANENDIQTIFDFIYELAEYEKLLHEVETDVVQLKEEIFGKHSKVEVLIAEIGDKAVGFAVFFMNFSTFLGRHGIYLEDLYVKPQHRGLGIGKRLLIKLAKLAKERNCARLEWWVLDWNEPAIEFYRSLGAVPKDEWTTFRLTGKDLDTLAQLK